MAKFTLGVLACEFCGRYSSASSDMAEGVLDGKSICNTCLEKRARLEKCALPRRVLRMSVSPQVGRPVIDANHGIGPEKTMLARALLRALVSILDK
jgi:hypothetical protein